MSSCKKSETGRERPPDKIKLTPLLSEYFINRRILCSILSGYEPFSATIDSISSELNWRFSQEEHNNIGMAVMSEEWEFAIVLNN